MLARVSDGIRTFTTPGAFHEGAVRVVGCRRDPISPRSARATRFHLRSRRLRVDGRCPRAGGGRGARPPAEPGPGRDLPHQQLAGPRLQHAGQARTAGCPGRSERGAHPAGNPGRRARQAGRPRHARARHRRSRARSGGGGRWPCPRGAGSIPRGPGGGGGQRLRLLVRAARRSLPRGGERCGVSHPESRRAAARGGRRLLARLRRHRGGGGGGGRPPPPRHRQARAAALRAGPLAHGARRRGRGHGGRQRGLGHPRRATGWPHGGALRSQGRVGWRRPLYGQVHAATPAAPRKIHALMRVLLHSGGLLLHPTGLREIVDLLGGLRRVALVTAASLHDEALTFSRLQGFLSPAPPTGAGLELLHLRWNDRPLETLAQAEALFMGGGNTYALLKRLREAGLLAAIRERVHAGMPYLGASAGSNVAGPNILTTNDWNVVALDRFDALGLVSFNSNPVVGLEEGALVRVEDGVVTGRGSARVKIFRRGQPPTWHEPGERLALQV